MAVRIFGLCVGALLLGWVIAVDAEEGGDRGAEIYSNLCISCHGPHGRGDGPLAQDLKLMPPDFIDSGWLAGRSDDEIVKSLTGNAHPAMAVANVLEEDALREAIAYVRKLSMPGKYLSLQRGRDIYNASCWVCHGPTGDGNGPAAKTIAGPKPRDFTSSDFVVEGREDEIADIIARGAAASFHGSPVMPEWSSSLSAQQIRDLVEYLRTFKDG